MLDESFFVAVGSSTLVAHIRPDPSVSIKVPLQVPFTHETFPAQLAGEWVDLLVFGFHMVVIRGGAFEGDVAFPTSDRVLGRVPRRPHGWLKQKIQEIIKRF